MQLFTIIVATCLCTTGLLAQNADASVSLVEKANRALSAHNFDEALALSQEGLAKVEKCDSCAADKVILRVQMSLVLRKLTRFQEAEVTGKQALKESQALLGENSEHTWLAMENLGHLYLALGQPVASAGYLNQLLKKLETTNSSNPNRRIDNLNALAYAYAMMSQDSRAERTLKDAIKLHSQAGLPENRSLGISLNHLGLLLANRRARDEAMDQHLRAAEIFRKHGDGNDVVAALVNIACLRLEDKNFPAADEVLEEATKILATTGPAMAPANGHVHRCRAVRYALGGHMPEALTEVKEAIKIYEVTLSQTHPELLDAKTCYAMLLRKNGQKKEAKSIESEIASAKTHNPSDEIRSNVIDYRSLLKNDK